MRRRLDRLRERFPIAYWRGRNALALGEWWWARRRTRDGDPGHDTYDDAFWDFHGEADWDGLAAIILRHCPARSVVDVGCGQGVVLEGFRHVDSSLRLRGDVEDALYEARAAPGNLLELPSILYRQAEAARYGRPRRTFHEEVRRPDVGEPEESRQGR